MSLFTSFSILICLTATFAYINHRFLRLPASIGIMFLAMVGSLIILSIGGVFPKVLPFVENLLASFDFSKLLLESMLSFMLFAGAINIRLDLLKQERLSVLVFSSLSVLISTGIVGGGIYLLLGWFGLQTSFVYCLLFGALISPTDPIAVLHILREAKISKSLEMKIAGESLFNDGVAVVVFLTILQVATHPTDFHWSDVVLLFCREASGGLLLGVMIGGLGLWLMRSIDNYIVEVLITLSVVMGGYSLADGVGVSGPLAMVAAGILIGNIGKDSVMSDITIEYVDRFWELIYEILNAVLFVLIGLQVLVVHFEGIYIYLGFISILLVLAARYVSIFLPAQLIKLKEEMPQRTILILTWGGLRGGLSVAMALSLKPEMQKDLWVTLTFFVVAFSILIQGLTIGQLNKRLL
jgi:monovalent cation:H+ antiporter, CPA1 family